MGNLCGNSNFCIGQVMRKRVVWHANTKGADQTVHPHSQIIAFVVRCLDSMVYIWYKFQQILASFCGWRGWFETNQVDHSRRHVFAWRGPYKILINQKNIINIAVFSEKTDVPHLPNQSMVAISVMKLWPWKLGQGHQNLISYWSCPINIGLQIW